MFHNHRYIVAGIITTCCVIFISMSGCRKQVSPSLVEFGDVAVTDSVPKNTQKGLLIISPAPGDTGIDIASGVVIRANTLREVTAFNVSNIVLRAGAETLAGDITASDTLVTFTPKFMLERSSNYTVEVAATVITQGDKELPPVRRTVSEKYTFTTTTANPSYIMSRQSTEVTDFARDGSELMQVGDHMYLYGGWTGEGSFNDVYRSNGDLSVWERMPDAPWAGRHTFGVAKIASGVFVFGGDYNNSNFDVWKTTNGVVFEPVATNLETSVKRRIIYGSCAHNGRLFVMGGQTDLDSLNAGLHDVWTSQNGLTWKKIADSLSFLGKNITGNVASFNGRIWVVGGGYYRHPDSTKRWTNEIYSSADGVTWRQEADGPWKGRQYADVCVWDNRLWMIGGHRGGNLAEVWYMNKNGEWIQYTPPNLFTARHASAVGIYNNRLVIACGDYNNECWVIEKS